MADRKLATIRRVSAVDDIPKKDRIGLAHIDGWTVIVQKEQIHAGDLVVFCEIDSVLPDAEWCSFLKDHRIRTMKMAGCLSQGIAFPLSILPVYSAPDGLYISEGDDVTEMLGITKWERPDATDLDLGNKGGTSGKKKFPKWLMKYGWFRWFVYKFIDKRTAKGFPDFVSKTDEVRIQNAPWYLDKDQEWVLTEKVDGQSGTFAVKKTHKMFGDKYETFVCSRNIRLFNPDNSSYWKVWEKYDLETILEYLCESMPYEWVCIQGEIIGPGIQGNKYKRTEPELYVFNFITDRDGRWASADAKALLEPLGIPWVPIIAVDTLPKSVEEMLKVAHGDSRLADTLREGLVCRTLDGKQSFKVVDPEFLIKWGE